MLIRTSNTLIFGYGGAMKNNTIYFNGQNSDATVLNHAKPIYVNKVASDGEVSSKVNKTPYTELLYINSGEVNLEIGKTTTRLEKYDLLILTARNKKAIVTPVVEGAKFDYLLICVAGISIKDSIDIENNELNVVKYNLKEDSNNLKTIIRLINHEYNNLDSEHELAIKSYVNLLIINLLRSKTTKFYKLKLKKNSKECEYIKQYMDENYSQKIKLDDLASLAFMNKFYLVHEFKKYIGKTPINYLVDRRVDASKELLATTNLSIEKIAEKVGFSSQSYFNQVFKKKLGTSPTQYRRSAKQSGK